jgi:Spy/CpxP family protein refolding chaperone
VEIQNTRKEAVMKKLSGTIFARDRGPEGRSAGTGLRNIRSALALLKAQFDADRASGTRPTFEQRKATREQLKSETLQQLSSVLTASQLKKFQVLMEDEHGPERGSRGRWHGDAPPSG